MYGPTASSSNESDGGESFFDRIQDSYYGLCDWIQDKGIPVYDWFVNPLEDRGVPSLPLLLVLLLVLLIGISALFLGVFNAQAQVYSLSVNVATDAGNVDGAKVSLIQGDSFVSALKTKDGLASFENIAAGNYTVGVEFAGFEDASQDVSIPETNSVKILLTPIEAGNETQGDGGRAGGDANTRSNSTDKLDFSTSSKSLTLHIFVKDERGVALANATAYVYDKAAGTKIGTVLVRDGYGSIQDLKEGMTVYADAASDGFAPYYGKNNSIVISAKNPNALKIMMSKLSDQQIADLKTSIIKITDLKDNVVSGAYIQVFKRGSSTSIPMQNYLTNATGELAVKLNSSGDPDYKAQASKSGFDSGESTFFKAGDGVLLKLRHPGEYTEEEKENSTNLTVAVSFEGNPVANAPVSVFSDSYTTRTGRTDYSGKVNFFLLNWRRTIATINSSKDIYAGSKTLNLTDKVMEVSLPLERPNASVIVKAIDYITNASVPNADFKALDSNGVYASCTALNGIDGCELKLPMGLTYKINASAPGFVSDAISVPINNPLMSVTFRLVNSSLIGDSMIANFRILNPETNDEASVLYPGKTYYAAFTLLANTTSADDKGGFYFGVEDSKAVIKRVEPPAPFMKGYSSASCNPRDFDWRNANVAWADLAYDGVNGILSKSVLVNFTIKDLNNVNEIPFKVRYRSYLLKSGKYYRNPFDQNLGFEPDSGALKSGCASPTFDKTVVINGVGVSCNDLACTRVWYTQDGGPTVKDNFTALMNTSSDSSTVPMLFNYEVTLKQSARDTPGDLLLSFSANAPYVGLLSMTYPGVPNDQGTPPDPSDTEVTFNDLRTAYAVDLNHLKQYSNMGAGFVFGGMYQIAPEVPVQGEKITLEYSAGSAKTTLLSTYNVKGADTPPPAVEPSAKLELSGVRQKTADGSYITDQMSLYANGLCSFDSIRNLYDNAGLPKCPVSFVETNYTVTVNKTADGRGYLYFNSSKGASSIDLIYKIVVSRSRGGSQAIVFDSGADLYAKFYKADLSDVVAGDVLTVSFLTTTTDAQGDVTLNFSFVNGIGNDGFNNLNSRIHLKTLPGSGGDPATFDYFPCGKAAIVLGAQQNGNGQVEFSSSCKNAILQVDPIMPLDAIPVEFAPGFDSWCGILNSQLNPPTDGSRDLSAAIQFDKNSDLSKPSWISFNAYRAGLQKGNDFDADPRLQPNGLGKATLKLWCSRFPSIIEISLVARKADSRIPAIDGSYIYYEGMPRQLVYSLYNGQIPLDLVVNASREPTSTAERTRKFDSSNRVNYFLINHNSLPVDITIKGTPYSQGVTIQELNNRFGSVYAHMIAISHLDLITFNKYEYFLTAVRTQTGIWNSTCPAIDYVSEVTHQIPRNFAEEAKRVALITGFRRSPPQNGYWCGHVRGAQQGERTCYPTLLNWMQPGIVETRQRVSCQAACLQVTEVDPDAYNDDKISLSLAPSNDFPSNGQRYAFNVTDSVEFTADVTQIPPQLNAVVTGVTLEYKTNSNQACPISGGSWCSVNFLNGDATLANSGSGVWKKAYTALTTANNGEFIVRVKAANETGGTFFYSPWSRVIVQNNVLACFSLSTQRQGVNDVMCGEPYCDPYCGPDGTKEIVTNAGPDFEHPDAWWLNDSVLQFVPPGQIEGIEKYQGMPYAYFKSKGVLTGDFSLSSPLMQWNWYVQDVANYGYQIEGGNTCEQGTGFYELKASSANGKNDGWSLKIQLKKLPLSGYLLNGEPSDSLQARNGYIDEIPPNPRDAVLGKSEGCGIGTDPGYSDVKDLCNAKNLVIYQHSHYSDNQHPQILDCFVPCQFNNCGYCINLNLVKPPQFDWQNCTPVGKRDQFTNFDALKQASYDPNLPADRKWAYGVGQELGGCPNEATRISN